MSMGIFPVRFCNNKSSSGTINFDSSDLPVTTSELEYLEYYIKVNYVDSGTPINSLQMEKDLKNLDKIPKHLAVLFWGKIEEKRLKEAAQLCCWAWRSGVKMLSIYDVEDDLKHNAQLLQFHIDAFSKHFFIHEKFVPIIRVTALGISTKYSNNEDSNLPDMHVNLISYADGRTRIVEVTKNFSEEVKQGKMISDELDVEELDRRLSVPQFSEPQLLILFSPKVELEGFPPWHIRLTEIL
ncbi:6333_t:CDS:2 [Scutellospora calospora]|uniref:6333_t:CDS:1 n=1 Tax=Scutellospora calospora TaxID=85575 RepID=A0ACA9JZY4_9GLOM|nr:6333_t:CDS:2 [Scutellospora calospora]